MNQNLMVAVILVIGVLAAVFAVMQNTRKFPYVKAGPLLSPAERKFYHALCQAVAPDQLVLVKIRVADLIKVKDGVSKSGTSSQFWKAFAQISQKHVDFVVVDRNSFEGRVGIELDDASHNSRKAKESDAIKNKAFEAAGVPLLRVKAGGSYEPNDLSVKLIAALNPPKVEKQGMLAQATRSVAGKSAKG